MPVSEPSPAGPEVLSGDPHQRATLLRHAWEEFFASGSLLPVVRPAIGASWRRSRRLGISPTHVVGPAERGFERLLKSQLRQLLFRAGERLAQRLAQQLDGARLSFTLADADGLILLQGGDKRLLAGGERLGILPGTRWAELDVGTNGLGTALASGQAMQVFAAEHYCESFHDLTCTAALVRHPLTRQALGVLDVTSLYTEPLEDVWQLTTESAALLEAEIRELLISSDRVLLEALATARDGVAAYATDLRGRRTIGNREATASIGPRDHAVLWGYVQQALAEPERGPVPHLLNSGRAVLVSIQPIVLGEDPVGALVVLRDDRHAAPGGQAPPAESWEPFNGAATWLLPARATLHSSEPVLILGESGTGKSALAAALHRARGGPLHSIDCADLTTSRWDVAWRQALAQGALGTIVLDRLLDLPARLQTRLLAMLDQRASVGGPRVVAIANADSEVQVRACGLRPDLLDRLAVNLLRVPLLRERAEEIPNISIELLNALHPGQAHPISDDALAALKAYAWPGNVRQLHNVLRRAALARPRGQLDVRALPPEIVVAAATPRLGRIDQLEVETILSTLQTTGGNVSRAAELMGLSRATVYRRLHVYHARRARGASDPK
jgi:sigma-54 dependent transcriptional regulator, acetoin dehydrogenase operon transcriptional activator AcoR